MTSLRPTLALLVASVSLLVLPAGTDAVVGQLTQLAGKPGCISETGTSGQLGAAGSVNNGSGQVVMDDLRPTTTDVTVTGLEDETGFEANWNVTAYAICANP